MSTFYGVYIVVTLGCTYYVVYLWIFESALMRESGGTGRALYFSKETKAKGLALFIVLALFWLQDRQRHEWSVEARAMVQFDHLLDKWSRGDKKEVIEELDQLSETERPWDDHGDSDRDN